MSEDVAAGHPEPPRELWRLQSWRGWSLGIRGATRARRHVTTFPADDPTRPADLVNRAFSAPDNALAESVIGLYKTELVKNLGPWTGLDELQLATLEWVDCWNHRRLLGPIGYVSPAESSSGGRTN